ncbi:hypothetical protein PCANC_27096, partial [Puccinia coronata f. sp. avenae]
MARLPGLDNNIDLETAGYCPSGPPRYPLAANLGTPMVPASVGLSPLGASTDPSIFPVHSTTDTQPTPAVAKQAPKRRARCTADEVAQHVAELALKRLRKAHEKVAVAWKKEAAKVAKDLLKASEAARTAAAQFIWSEAASLELVEFVKTMKDNHCESEKAPGFVKFPKYFFDYHKNKEQFTLLASLDNECLLHCIGESGSAGLFTALVDCGMSNK